MSGIGSSHHVLGVEHLLSQLGDGNSTELRAIMGGERGKANHEEMQARERNQVDSHLSEIGVQLSREL